VGQDIPARWRALEAFVRTWYAVPLKPSDVVLGDKVRIGLADVALAKVGPVALAEWFRLVGRRPEREEGGFLIFPEPTVFSRWPQRPRATTTMLDAADLRRGLLPVLTNDSGHGGYGLRMQDPAEDPPVHCLLGEMDEAEADEPFPGTLSQLLTAAVIAETLRDGEEGVGPLGKLARGVKRLEGPLRDGADLAAAGLRLVGEGLPGQRLHANEDETALVGVEADGAQALVRTPAARQAVQALFAPS
jgi:hypothetical protein